MGTYPLVKRPTPLKDIMFGDVYNKFVEGKNIPQEDVSIEKAVTEKVVQSADGKLFSAIARRRLLRGNK